MANFRLLILTGTLLVLAAFLETTFGQEAANSTEPITTAVQPRIFWWCRSGTGFECFKFANQRNQICDARGWQRRWEELYFVFLCHCCGLEESPTTTAITTLRPPSPPTTTEGTTTSTTL